MGKSLSEKIKEQPVESQIKIESRAQELISCPTFKLHNYGGQDAHPTRVI